MKERILVPLNGTEVGEAVLPKVEDLIFKNHPGHDIEVTLLHVISRLNFNFLNDDEAAQLPYDNNEITRLTQEAQDYLEKIAVVLRNKGVSVKTMVSTGRAAEEIVKAAHAIDAHLIAMSTHNRSRILRLAIESVTDKVIRLEEKIPVLAVNVSRQTEELTGQKGSLKNSRKS